VHEVHEGPTDHFMGYYTRSDLPFYYALADEFTLCDHYFCSVLGPSDPNQHYSVSGTIDPDGLAGGPVPTNASDVQAVLPSKVATNAALYSWTTMPERLQAQGVSWKAYTQSADLGAASTTDNVFLRYKAFSDPTSALYRNAFLSSYPHDFVADVEAGTLPQVSWVYAPNTKDEHPPNPANAGEQVTGRVLRTLFANPKVWAQTVVFLTYDENGGFFDHVPPPTAPPGTPGEYLTTSPLPVGAGTIAGPIGFGFRVPLLVMSPFSRGGRISSDVSDHTSLLRFLETRFGVEVPNLSAWRRQTASDLTGTLDFTRPRLKPPTLNFQVLSDQLVSRECGARSAQPPNHQRLPTQHS
jgi:phospholipase C